MAMATYVLVGGAWLGGWCWEPVARPLRAAGHDVHPVTLTGLGERVHLAERGVDLETHIADVVNLVAYDDLRDVVLVGHSYAGLVITGVADRIPERLARLAYLDSGPAPDGTAYVDLLAPPARELVDRLVAQAGDGWRLPLPSWEVLGGPMGADLRGLGPAERERLRARAVPQPVRTLTRPLSRTNPAAEALPRLLLTCSVSLAQVQALIAGGHPWFRELAGPRWSFLELPTGHWPMFSAPEALAALLATRPATPATRPATPATRPAAP
jgi:pimeloyl-ACP methyl ester carboxylesterase